MSDFGITKDTKNGKIVFKCDIEDPLQCRNVVDQYFDKERNIKKGYLGVITDERLRDEGFKGAKVFLNGEDVENVVSAYEHKENGWVLVNMVCNDGEFACVAGEILSNYFFGSVKIERIK